MVTRRRFLALAGRTGAGLTLARSRWSAAASSEPVRVNDVHSQLNPTHVAEVARPGTVAEVREVLAAAQRAGRAVSIAGGRHAMGGQQFGEGTVLVDTRAMQRVLGFDVERGLIEVEAGIQWPELVAHLLQTQRNASRPWGIVQKQTGADRLCLGGALGANAHGRGLRLKPIVGDVESFALVDASGALKRCSRTENAELFRLAIGGYGLFGVVTSVRLRLAPRRKLERVVAIVDTGDLMDAFEARIAEGYLYGDCQFAIDPGSDRFLRAGVFSCYRPVDDGTAVPAGQKALGEAQWRELYRLAHADPKRAFEVYSTYYLSTSGQLYWSDTHQLSTYIDDYHRAVDRQVGALWPGTEMITEVYVPRPELDRFLRTLAGDFRRHAVRVIYGTIRLIERDDESFLAWARDRYACIVMNLHVAHSPQGIVKASNDFRRVIDRAIEHGGSYFLTYHRWAQRRQLDACYPQMAAFLEHKRRHDPQELFQSDWYRHHRRMYT